MKKAISLILINAVIVIFMVSALITGCTKEGPMGPAGPNGANGTNGTNGTPGKDVTSLCLKCHSNQVMSDNQAAYAVSGHATGTTWARGASTGCAACHSNAGYIEACNKTLTVIGVAGGTVTGSTSTAATLNPIAIQCQGCHDKHLTFDTVPDFNYAMRAPTTFNYRFDSTYVKTIPSYEGCGSCHQPRVIANMPDLTKPNATQVWSGGPHHGTQVAVLFGAGIEIPGNTAYNKSHSQITKCAVCHMGKSADKSAGGHTLKMVAKDGSDALVASCEKCHDKPVTSYNINGRQTEIDGLLQDLITKLEASIIAMNKKPAGSGGYGVNYTRIFLKSTTSPEYSLSVVRADGAKAPTKVGMTNIQIAAWINFQIVVNDRSHGAHNYKYSKALLENSIAAVTAQGF